MLVLSLHLEKWEVEYHFRCFVSDSKRVVSFHLEFCLFHFLHVFLDG